MRVDYTLPALQPWSPADSSEVSEEGRSSFGQVVRGGTIDLPSTLEEQLRLDARPFTGTYIGPPPPPLTLEMQDAETQRQRWHGMIRRHSESTGNVTRGSFGRGASVQNMLEMLREMQHMEDSIVSQTVALARG
jgi:hypothetical protein